MQLHTLLIAAAMTGAVGSTAHAQFNDRPFSFSAPAPEVGMSTAGRQAIVNRELRGVSPDTMIRGPRGQLLEVERGPEGLAVVRRPYGDRFIPRTGRRSSAGARAGEFNSFFVRFDGLSYRSQIGTPSGATIAGWTGNVSGYVTRGGNSVDQWTSMVYRSH